MGRKKKSAVKPASKTTRKAKSPIAPAPAKRGRPKATAPATQARRPGRPPGSKNKPKDNTPNEAEEMRLVAKMLDNAPGLIWFHPPNEGKRDGRTGAHLKMQGMKKGVPDILIFSQSNNDDVGAAIELKRQPCGTRYPETTPEQDNWLANLNQLGWQTAVAYGAEHCYRVLVEMGYNVEWPRSAGRPRRMNEQTALPLQLDDVRDTQQEAAG